MVGAAYLLIDLIGYGTIPVFCLIVLLKAVLPAPPFGMNEECAFLRYRHGGRTYVAKVVADGFVVVWMVLLAVAIAARWKLWTPLAMFAGYAPFFAPGIYLVMQPRRDRTIRFVATAIFAAWWLFQAAPCVN